MHVEIPGVSGGGESEQHAEPEPPGARDSTPPLAEVEPVTPAGDVLAAVRIDADAEANREEHGRLWLALRLFFYGTLVALAGLLVAKVLG